MPRSLLYPFQIDPRGGIAYTEDPARILQQDIIGAVGTQIGERVRNFGYGTRAIEHSFDPNDQDLLAALDETVRTALGNWVPQIVVTGIETATDEQNGSVGLLIRYTLNNLNEASVSVPIPLREDFV